MSIKKRFKQKICNHLDEPLSFVKNLYGDMVYISGGYRSVWECPICGKRIYRSRLFDQGRVSDGYHTFDELYHHRAVLFSVICREFPELSWKSKHHADNGGPMYDGMFIVGIETPKGPATYHYDIDPYWDMFDVKELDNAPEWDGHTPEQAIERIASLPALTKNLKGV